MVREQFPELATDSVRFLGSGFEHDAYLVDEAVVFRFPRYAAVADGLDHDRLIHEFARAHVDDSVRIPDITFRGQRGPTFPHPFVGHVAVPGVGLDDRDVRLSAPPELGADLGTALGHVHSAPVDEAAAVGASRLEPDCDASLAALRLQLPHVPELAELTPDAYRWANSVTEVPSDADVPARFIHNGLHEEHVIVDPESGRLSGIIDWSSAAIGDPAIDFAFLLAIAGPDIYREALAAYRLDLDEGFDDRVAFRARVRTIGWLAYGVRRGVDTLRSQEQVGFAFSGLLRS